MHRNHPQPRKNRTNAEHEAAQPMAGQPHADEDDEEQLHEADQVPSFLTARELQARTPGKGESDNTSDGDDAAEADDSSQIDDDPPPKRKAGKR